MCPITFNSTRALEMLDDQTGLKLSQGGEHLKGEGQSVRSIHFYTRNKADVRAANAEIQAANQATADAVRAGLIEKFGHLKGTAIFKTIAGRDQLTGDKPISTKIFKDVMLREMRSEKAAAGAWQQRVRKSTIEARPAGHAGGEPILKPIHEATRGWERHNLFLAGDMERSVEGFLAIRAYSAENVILARNDADHLLLNLRLLRDRLSNYSGQPVNGWGDVPGAEMGLAALRLSTLIEALEERAGVIEERRQQVEAVRLYLSDALTLKAQAGTSVLDSLIGRLPDDDQKAGRTGALNQAKASLSGKARELDARLGGDPNPEAVKQAFEEYSDFIVSTLRGATGEMRFHSESGQGKPAKVSEKKLIELFKKAHLEALNAPERWEAVSQGVILAGPGGTPVQLTSTITPAAHLSCPFAESYQGKGVSSGSTRERHHAVNLARTELRDANGRLLFQGVRHGVHCAYGLESGTERRAANKSRAVETLTALAQGAVDANPSWLEGKNPLELPVVSLSLLTPDAFRRGGSNEARFLREQTAAWQDLARQPLSLEVRAPGGQSVRIRVQPRLATFNFPVNEVPQGASSAKAFFGGGRIQSHRMNAEAFNVLFGKDFMDTHRRSFTGPNLGGLVGARMAALPPADQVKISALAHQCRTLWQTDGHRETGKNPYRLAARLAVLSSLLGFPPAFNCKSGKDRTGQLDVESKLLAYQAASGPVPEFGSDETDATRSARTRMALFSGNFEMQWKNTGLPGFKTFNVRGLDASFESPEAVVAHRGLSRAVSD